MRSTARLQDVAKAAGVSYPVASLVLSGKSSPHVRYSEETRERVTRVARDLGYRPNRSARKFVEKRHGCLGLLARSVFSFSRMTFNAMAMTAQEHDYMLSLDHLGFDSKVKPRCLQEDMVDGAIVFHGLPEKWEEEIDRVEIPAVRVNTNRRSCNGAISFNERQGMERLVAAFAERGRRHACLLTVDLAPDGEPEHYSRSERRLALEAISTDAGMRASFWGFTDSQIKGALLVERLGENPDLDAIIVLDRFLPKVFHACAENGRQIGEDISVMCYQPSWNASLSTPTCGGIQIPEFHLGKLAVETLLQVFAGEEVGAQMLEYKIVAGESL